MSHLLLLYCYKKKSGNVLFLAINTSHICSVLCFSKAFSLVLSNLISNLQSSLKDGWLYSHFTHEETEGHRDCVLLLVPKLFRHQWWFMFLLGAAAGQIQNGIVMIMSWTLKRKCEHAVLPHEI